MPHVVFIVVEFYYRVVLVSFGMAISVKEVWGVKHFELVSVKLVDSCVQIAVVEPSGHALRLLLYRGFKVLEAQAVNVGVQLEPAFVLGGIGYGYHAVFVAVGLGERSVCFLALVVVFMLAGYGVVVARVVDEVARLAAHYRCVFATEGDYAHAVDVVNVGFVVGFEAVALLRRCGARGFIVGVPCSAEGHGYGYFHLCSCLRGFSVVAGVVGARPCAERQGRRQDV